MLLSHPNYPLKSHLINTKNRALEKYKPPKLKYFDGEIIREILKIITLSHDFEKATIYFQKYIREEKVKNF
ncbi:CRISPR-associated helicase Cas3 [Methanocaldococcus lauensis]|nr:CRISPR-associated helicase Cas3 [Methanocaldococcus lauensis]